MESAEGRSLQFELGAENQYQEAELFKEALSRSALSRYSHLCDWSESVGVFYNSSSDISAVAGL